MLTATIIATAVEVQCPHCQEPIAELDGSFVWEIHQLEAAAEKGTIECHSCGKTSRLRAPKRIAHA